MNYTIYWCDNNACAMRGNGEDSFFKDHYSFESDREALEEAYKIVYDPKYYEDPDEDYTEDDLKSELDEVDSGAGYPVIFWIEREGEKIYDSGLTREKWLLELCDNEFERDL